MVEKPDKFPTCPLCVSLNSVYTQTLVVFALPVVNLSSLSYFTRNGFLRVRPYFDTREPYVSNFWWQNDTLPYVDQGKSKLRV